MMRAYAGSHGHGHGMGILVCLRRTGLRAGLLLHGPRGGGRDL